VAKSRLPRPRFIPAARELTRPRGSFVPARGSLDTMARLDQKQTLLPCRRGKGSSWAGAAVAACHDACIPRSAEMSDKGNRSDMTASCCAPHEGEAQIIASIQHIRSRGKVC
jgi:hypothetical protein